MVITFAPVHLPPSRLELVHMVLSELVSPTELVLTPGKKLNHTKPDSKAGKEVSTYRLADDEPDDGDSRSDSYTSAANKEDHNGTNKSSLTIPTVQVFR